MKIRVEITVRPHSVKTSVRFYMNPYVFVEYCMVDVDMPLYVYDSLTTSKPINEFIERIREVTNEDGKSDSWRDKPLEGMDGAFIIVMNVYVNSIGVYDKLDIMEARHVRVQGEGKDLSFAFETSLRDKVIRNIFTLVGEGEVNKLNNIFKALRV